MHAFISCREMKASQERLAFWDVKEGRCGKPSHYCKSRLYSSCSHLVQGPPGDQGEPGDPGQDGDQVSSKLMKATCMLRSTVFEQGLKNSYVNHAGGLQHDSCVFAVIPQYEKTSAL